MFCFGESPRTTFPKSRLAGLAPDALTPVPFTGTSTGTHAPPPTGHSDRVSVRLVVARLVGVKVSLTVQVPGPVKPPAAAQVPPAKAKGAVVAVPEPLE